MDYVGDQNNASYFLRNHLLTIWDGLSDFIEKQMLQVKGVNLSGFGTFTFSRRKVDIGCGKVLMVLRPVFAMSESFIQTHSLLYSKQLVSGQIPVVAVNYTVLSNGTPFSRDTVEFAIQEIVQVLGKAIAASKNINLDFPRIGRLVIKDKKGHMKFFKEFVRSIDSTGKIDYAFKQATLHGSEGSVISNPASKISNVSVERSSTASASNSLPDDSPFSDNLFTYVAKTPKVEDRPCTPFHNDFTLQPETVFSITPQPNTDYVKNEKNYTGPCPQSLEDMCYVCHQRELRNVPVHLAEELKRKENLHNKVLQEFQQKKTAMLLAHEKRKHIQNFEKAKEAAEFNLHATENRKLREMKEILRNSEYYPSFIFSHRPMTPCFTRKQAEYCCQLEDQIRRRRNTIEAIKKHEMSVEKNEQEQLSEELTLIKEAHKEKVRDLKASYLQSLNDQINFKAHVSQSASPMMQPVFVVQESAAIPSQDKQKSKDVYVDQLALFLRQQQAKKVEALKEKEEDALQLKLNLQDYKKDIQNSRLARCQARKQLEEHWQDALKSKEQGAQRFARDEFDSLLLHDQCRKYLRCRQCQRKVNNLGRSNILRESRYASGARLII